MKEDNSIEIGKRIKKAANYLVYIDEIELASGLLFALGYNKTNSSKCFNGDAKYANTSFIDKLCDRYSIFNKDWMITGEGQILKETSPSPPSNERESVYERLFEKKEKELSDLRIEKDSEIKKLERKVWELEQELQVFTSRKKTVQEPEDAAGAADIMDGMAG